jgi:hypothetical protein
LQGRECLFVDDFRLARDKSGETYLPIARSMAKSGSEKVVVGRYSTRYVWHRLSVEEDPYAGWKLWEDASQIQLRLEGMTWPANI